MAFEQTAYSQGSPSEQIKNFSTRTERAVNRKSGRHIEYRLKMSQEYTRILRTLAFQNIQRWLWSLIRQHH